MSESSTASLSRSGVDVASACLAHVNRNYVYPGGEIDPRRFFRIRNLTRRVERLQPKLTFQLRSEFTVLAMPKAPDIAPGRHCTDPVTCEFYRPLQSAAPERSHRLPAKNPRQRDGGTGRNGRRVHPRHP